MSSVIRGPAVEALRDLIESAPECPVCSDENFSTFHSGDCPTEEQRAAITALRVPVKVQ